MPKKFIAIEEQTHKILEKERNKRKKNGIAGIVKTIGTIADEYIIKYIDIIRTRNKNAK